MATHNPSAHYILVCPSRDSGQKAIVELKERGITASIELMQFDITKDADKSQSSPSVIASHGKLDVDDTQYTCFHLDW